MVDGLAGVSVSNLPAALPSSLGVLESPIGSSNEPTTDSVTISDPCHAPDLSEEDLSICRVLTNNTDPLAHVAPPVDLQTDIDQVSGDPIFTWNSPTNPENTTYAVQISTDPDFSDPLQFDVLREAASGVTFPHLSDLSPDTEYFWRVGANPSREGAPPLWSEEIGLFITPARLEPVSFAEIENDPTTNFLSLSWVDNDNSQETTYNLEIYNPNVNDPERELDYIYVEGMASRSYSFSNAPLINGATYAFRLEAENPNGGIAELLDQNGNPFTFDFSSTENQVLPFRNEPGLQVSDQTLQALQGLSARMARKTLVLNSMRAWHAANATDQTNALIRNLLIFSYTLDDEY
ncbi:MAG: hypothetical protein KJ732_08190 [Candidatus Margulisbacteria bacterium]|nr:hypothetical protein [Candidatus Margulisiibacteriota bacterium]